MRGEFICSASAGSIVAGINKSTGLVETDGYTKWKEVYTVHPDTGIPIKGIRVPKWDELCALAKELALHFDTIRYIGWDFAYTAEKNGLSWKAMKTEIWEERSLLFTGDC